jgi:TolB-like protein
MKISKLGLSVVGILLTYTALSWAMELKEVEVTGSGYTRQEAVYAALIEAVRQVNGVEVASETQTCFSYKEFSQSVDGVENQGAAAENDVSKNIRSKAKGYIERYEILDSGQFGGHWDVTLLAYIPKYKTPGISPNSRRKIAILPFRATNLSYHFHGQSVPASMISKMFTQKMVTEITQTRRFTVLDREYMEEFLSEKNMILSGDAPVSEQIKIGQLLGVDYLLIGTITNFEQKQKPYTIRITGETGINLSASFTADYRIVVMATRQIKWSDSVTVFLGHEEIEQMVPTLDPDEIQQQMLILGAKLIIHKAMENIYPIRIVEVQHTGDIVLNQGGVTLKQGEILDIYSLGEKIDDPYTKESLGSSELWVASVEISRVIPKMSYAKIIKGDSKLIQKGQICRRQPDINNLELPKKPGRTSDVQSTESGGVVLPFD